MYNLCNCAACRLRRRRIKQGLEFKINLTDEEKEEIKSLLTKILNGETNSE